MILHSSNLQSQAVSHGFLGRTGGVSEGIFASLNCGPGSGDGRPHVIENRRRALAELSTGANAKLLTLYQIHSPDAVIVTEPWEIGEAPRADAMATNMCGVAMGILTADCAPVLFADINARVIGAAHAGWKGAFGGVVESCIASMEHLSATRANIAAAIGPCISQANYEVGAEFLARVRDVNPQNERYFVPSDKPDHFRFDLSGYVASRLAEAGIENVETISACTYADEVDFFSYRRATHRGEPDYGRQLSAIVLT